MSTITAGTWYPPSLGTAGTWYPPSLGTGGFLAEIEGQLFTNPPFRTMSTDTITAEPIIMWRLRWGDINPVQCTKFTANYVWPVDYNGNRKSRLSEWSSYHETWADAHAALLAQAEFKLVNCRRELERLKGDHGRIKGMKPPAKPPAGVEVGP